MEVRTVSAAEVRTLPALSAEVKTLPAIPDGLRIPQLYAAESVYTTADTDQEIATDVIENSLNNVNENDRRVNNDNNLPITVTLGPHELTPGMFMFRMI